MDEAVLLAQVRARFQVQGAMAGRDFAQFRADMMHEGMARVILPHDRFKVRVARRKAH
ncbi:MAG: hypothetical protein HN333_12355 [Rhodospirillaceae bacterium]|nr:hypothetical protein [Rhodospirillaceae bacterium]